MKKLIFIYFIITVIQISLLMIYIGIKLDNISDNISSNIESSIDKNKDEKVKIEIYQDGDMLKSFQIDWYDTEFILKFADPVDSYKLHIWTGNV